MGVMESSTAENIEMDLRHHTADLGADARQDLGNSSSWCAFDSLHGSVFFAT